MKTGSDGTLYAGGSFSGHLTDVLRRAARVVGNDGTGAVMKAKDTTHAYTGWRQRLGLQQQKQLGRIERRAAQTDAPVLTDDQLLIVGLAKILDEGGETTEYIRDLHDAE